MANNNIDLTINKPIKRSKRSPLSIELSTQLSDGQNDGVIVNQGKTVLSINVEQPITLEKNKNKSKKQNKRLTIDYSGVNEIPSENENEKDNTKPTKQTLFINLGEPFPEQSSGDGDKPEASHIEINIENLPIFIGGKIDVEIINPQNRAKINTDIQLRYRLLTTYLRTYDVTCHWISTNPEVATIDDDGLLHVLQVGQTTIRLEIIYNKDTTKRGYAEFTLTAIKRGFTYTFNFQLS